MKWRDFRSESSSGLHCTNKYGSLDHPMGRSSNRQCIGSTTSTIRISSYRVRIARTSSKSLKHETIHREKGKLTHTHDICIYPHMYVTVHTCVHPHTSIHTCTYTNLHTHNHTHKLRQKESVKKTRTLFGWKHGRRRRPAEEAEEGAAWWVRDLDDGGWRAWQSSLEVVEDGRRPRSWTRAWDEGENI